jgi:hypothetical protein
LFLLLFQKYFIKILIFFFFFSFHLDIEWKKEAITIAVGNDHENQLNQLHQPHGIFIDDDQNHLYC